MQTMPIAHCNKNLDFKPRRPWPEALPAFAWRGQLLSGFGRSHGQAIDLYELQRASLIEAMKAAHPELGLSELARFSQALALTWPELFHELREGLFQEYGLRWSDRLNETLLVLVSSPRSFQDWVDDKKVGTRELAALLALQEPAPFHPFLHAITKLEISRAEGIRALELGTELYLMGHPLNDILPSTDNPAQYLKQLEKWRRPNTIGGDEQWCETVKQWPWPSQVRGKWQRFGDQSGLEINIRTTSPQDLHKKLERLLSIGDTWHDRKPDQ